MVLIRMREGKEMKLHRLCQKHIFLSLFGGATPLYLPSTCSCSSEIWIQMRTFAAMLASAPLLPPLLVSLPVSVSHFNAELIQCGWAVQEQPSSSALLLHARQEVARTAACNST